MKLKRKHKRQTKGPPGFRRFKGPARTPKIQEANHETVYGFVLAKDAKAAIQYAEKFPLGPRPSCRHCHGTGWVGYLTPPGAKSRVSMLCCCLAKPPTGAMLREAEKTNTEQGKTE